MSSASLPHERLGGARERPAEPGFGGGPDGNAQLTAATGVVLRLLAPLVVLSTVAVFATGVVLLYDGPAHRDPWMLLHKASFIVWIAATTLHVLGHLLELPGALRAPALDRPSRSGQSGGAGRAIVLSGAIVGGLVLAIALIPDFSTWTAHLSPFDAGH